MCLQSVGYIHFDLFVFMHFLIKVIDCLKLFNVYFFWDCVGFWRKLNDYGFFFFFLVLIF